MFFSQKTSFRHVSQQDRFGRTQKIQSFTLSHVLLMEKSCLSLFWWRKWYSRFLSEKTWRFWDRCRRRLSQETAQKNEKRYLRIFFSRTIYFRRMSQEDLFRRAQKTPSFTHTLSRHKKIVFIVFSDVQNGLRDFRAKRLTKFCDRF